MKATACTSSWIAGGIHDGLRLLLTTRVAQGNLVSKSTVVGAGEPGGFLHFEVRYNGVPVDPADFVQVPGREVIRGPDPTPTQTPTVTPTPEPTRTPTPKPTAKPGQTAPGPRWDAAAFASSDREPPMGPPTAHPRLPPRRLHAHTDANAGPPKNTPTPLPRAQ